MKEVIAALAVAAFAMSVPAAAQINSAKLPYNVEHVEKLDSGAAAVVRVTNPTQLALFATVQCFFKDWDFVTLTSGSGSIQLLPPRSDGHVKIEAFMGSDALRKFKSVECVATGVLP